MQYINAFQVMNVKQKAVKDVFSLLILKGQHIINAQQLAMKKMTLLLGVPHWWMILENTLEKVIGAIVGQTVPLIHMVSERLTSFYYIVSNSLCPNPTNH